MRCPDPACAVIFRVDEAVLGRNTRCPVCHIGLTARPVDVEVQLRRQQERVAATSGADVLRLPLAVLVDNVRSLWNVGSIFRTADACGVSKLMLTGITGCPPRAEISKTALGAEAAVAWAYRADPVAALAELQAEGYVAVALENSQRAVPVDALDWPTRVALVIGNEVAGVSPALMEACPVHATIPMRGLKESLNVAVAFGIAAYSAARALAAATRR